MLSQCRALSLHVWALTLIRRVLKKLIFRKKGLLEQNTMGLPLKVRGWNFSTPSTLDRQTCAPFSTPSWPPLCPSSQVRLPPLPCAAEHWNAAGPLLVWLYLVRAGGWGRPIARRRGAPPSAFFRGTIAFGLQASGSSSPRRFQTGSLRPPLGPPPHRRPPERLSSEGLHRPSRASFPAPSSPSRFPTSQVRLRSLGARACMVGRGFVVRAGRGWPIAPRPRIRPRIKSLVVQASLQLSGWSLR
jgi:hypothetical protein